MYSIRKMQATYVNDAEEFLNKLFTIFFQIITCVIKLQQLFVTDSMKYCRIIPLSSYYNDFY